MKTTILRILGVIASVICVLFIIVVVRTTSLETDQPTPDPPDVPKVEDDAPQRLARAIRIRTVSPETYDEDELRPFRRLHAGLEEWFPTVHRTLETEVVPPCSLLYRWEGMDPDKEAAIWLSHLDVVPVDSPRKWSQEPYAGTITDGYVWGRGAMDVKCGVTGILEAAETLLREGFRPERTVYFAFGCDEEVGGSRGAKRIAALLERRGVRAAYVLDEGQGISDGLVPGLDRPAALIGIAEKGYLTLKLHATGPGGHSSMPSSSTSTGALARAIRRLENRPFPARFNRPTRQMFRTLGPEFPFYQRAMFANLWLFEPILIDVMTGTAAANASVRTTTAVTKLRAGKRENVLPGRATATVNFRIEPGSRIEDVKAHVREVVRDEIRIEDPDSSFESNPSPISETDGRIWDAIRSNVRGVFGEQMLSAPALTIGATDSRYYSGLTDQTYRFLPIVLGPSDTERMHGVDERLSVENYRKLVRYYMAMLRDA